VIYARLHILTSIIFIYYDMSYISFITLFMILFIQLPSIYSFRYVIIAYTLFICTSIFPFFYTLIGSLSDDPRFARPDIGCFISLIRCSLRLYASQGPRVSFNSILVFLLLLYSYCFLILPVSLSVIISSLCLFIIMYGCLYVILQ